MYMYVNCIIYIYIYIYIAASASPPSTIASLPVSPSPGRVI